MADDLVTRLREVFADTPEILSWLDVQTYQGAETYQHIAGMWGATKEAADYIEQLEARVKELEDGLLQVIVALSDDGDING